MNDRWTAHLVDGKPPEAPSPMVTPRKAAGSEEIPHFIRRLDPPTIYFDESVPFVLATRALILIGCLIENDGAGNIVVRYRPGTHSREGA